MKQLKSHPWFDWNEWIEVYSSIFDEKEDKVWEGIELVNLWRSRGNVPHSVDMTSLFIEYVQRISETSVGGRGVGEEERLRLEGCALVTRFVNGLVDPKQTGYYASSVSSIGSDIHIPFWVVELRHDAAHNSLPSLSSLCLAAEHSVAYLKEFYWDCQRRRLQGDMEEIASVLSKFVEDKEEEDGMCMGRWSSSLVMRVLLVGRSLLEEEEEEKAQEGGLLFSEIGRELHKILLRTDPTYPLLLSSYSKIFGVDPPFPVGKLQGEIVLGSVIK